MKLSNTQNNADTDLDLRLHKDRSGSGRFLLKMLLILELMFIVFDVVKDALTAYVANI